MTHPSDELRDDGPVCENCGQRIPLFKTVPDEKMQRIRKLMRGGQKAGAMRELVEAAECSMTSAKLWVLHDGRSHPRPAGTTCQVLWWSPSDGSGQAVS